MSIIKDGVNVVKETKQEPRIMQSSITGVFYYVTRYKDLGNGNFEAISKREANAKEIRDYKKKSKEVTDGNSSQA